MMEVYEKYLEIIGGYLSKYFEQQKPYIFCKEGCSLCCETVVYPLSQQEFEYLMLGYGKLSEDKKEQIQANIKQIKEEKDKFKPESSGEVFMHACPFLLNKSCSVYDYRGMICRSYGLMSYTVDENDQEKYQMPYCVDQGLNFSSVYDPKTGTISSEMWKESGIAEEPVSYNIGLKFLLNNDITERLQLKFSEPKGIIDWF